jgi:hypothetical protein
MLDRKIIEAEAIPSGDRAKIQQIAIGQGDEQLSIATDQGAGNIGTIAATLTLFALPAVNAIPAIAARFTVLAVNAGIAFLSLLARPVAGLDCRQPRLNRCQYLANIGFHRLDDLQAECSPVKHGQAPS